MLFHYIHGEKSYQYLILGTSILGRPMHNFNVLFCVGIKDIRWFVITSSWVEQFFYGQHPKCYNSSSRLVAHFCFMMIARMTAKSNSSSKLWKCWYKSSIPNLNPYCNCQTLRQTMTLTDIVIEHRSIEEIIWLMVNG